ncbi:ABC transporter G family member 36 [Phytophthora ramorum]|uniref:ABC transporter G family member 36 n=1 Tax=Phytophthora ramorum TaxID=164328 RepID=UPI0030B5C367|nr:ABC transporter G family member 36 [Phytophthora ramorum]
MATDEAKTSLLQPEANDGGEQVPEVYRSLNFRSLQDPYSNRGGDIMTSRYSTLRADDLDTMLNGGLERFYKKYDHLSRKINLQLPTPEVRFENLSFSVQVPAEVGSHGTVGSHLASIFTPWQKIPMTTKHALHPMSGIIKPGSMTLILANPGAGKSTFLKAMAGKLQDNASTEIGGEILYSGLKGEEIDLIKLVGLVDQTDNHIPTLTVRETFKFADVCVNGRPEDQPDEMKDIAALRTELFIQILGLEDCSNTVVGDALLRGVSGGERKRVTIGEVLVGGQSLFLCDEISTGLDSAATFDIIKSMRTWCKTLGGSAVIALLQPTPEVVEINMLSEFSSDRYSDAQSKTLLESFSISQGTGYIWFGVIVLLAYYFVFTTFNGLALHFIRYEKYKGVTPKALKDNTPDEDDVYIQVKTPGGPDQASKGGFTAYFGDLGVDSVKMLEYFASIPGTEEIRPQYNPATYMLEVIGAGIGRDVKDYSVEYKNSELCAKNRERTLELCEVSDDFVRHSTLNYRSIATGFWNQLGQLAKKQQLTYWRNPQYNFMRMFLFPIFAVIFGTTFYQLSADSVKRINSHIGLIYNSMDFIGVVNLMTVLEVTCAERAVFYRERMSNYYGPLPYSLSLWFAEVPYLVVVIILFVAIEYWLVGWSDNAGDFFFFMFVFYLYTSACTYVGQWMSVLMPNEKVANVAVGAISCLFNLFSGYLLPRTAMKAGYKWFTYLMPSSYSLSALVGAQFGDSQDIISVPSGNTTTDMTVAHYIEITYDFRPNRKYNFMVGLLVIWAVVQIAIYLTLKYVSHLKR